MAVGGPLKRDRAWIFVGYQPAITRTERTVTFSFDNSTATNASEQLDQFFNINQTTQVRDSLRTRATLNWNPSKQERHAAGPRRRHVSAGQFRHHRQAPELHCRPQCELGGEPPKVSVGARAGYFASNHTTANVTEQPLFLFPRSNIGLLDVPASLQHVGGFQTDLSNDVSRVDRLSRINAQVDSTFFGNLAGEHTLKAGVQLNRRGNDVDKGQSANRVSLFWNAALAGQRGLYGYYRVTSNPIDPKRGQTTSGNVSDTIVGLFVQDSWTVNRRLTVNLGLRTRKRDRAVL